MKREWKDLSTEEKILLICSKTFWPVFIMWVICILAKIAITVGVFT